MPVLLSKPFSVGDLDPNAGEGYPMAQLTGLYHNGLTMSITLEWQFGTASGQYYEVWQRGLGSPTKSCEVPGSEVVPLWSQLPQEGESVGQAIRRVTYEYLINRGFVAGTIVNNPPLPPAESAENATGSGSTETPAQGDDTPAAQPATDTSAPAEGASGTAPDSGTEVSSDQGSTSETPAEAPAEGSTDSADSAPSAG